MKVAFSFSKHGNLEKLRVQKIVVCESFE